MARGDRKVAAVFLGLFMLGCTAGGRGAGGATEAARIAASPAGSPAPASPEPVATPSPRPTWTWPPVTYGCGGMVPQFRITQIEAPSTASSQVAAVLGVHYLGSECRADGVVVMLDDVPPRARDGYVTVTAGPFGIDHNLTGNKRCSSARYCDQPGVATRSISGWPVGRYVLRSESEVEEFPRATASIEIVP